MTPNATVFTTELMETDKTGETDLVSNGEFLRAVFGDDLADVRPVVVSFTGNPTSAPGKVWFGSPWQGSADMTASLPGDANNYFSLAVFKPDEAGQYRRQKARFYALHTVMLDDVGSKVAMERLTLPPSWMLETSPGNHQAGYLLREPLADGLAADKLMNAIVAANLCDPGANGPRARLARLPVAVNGKHAPPFVCRMLAWSPELRYSVEELVDGLQLEMTQAARPKRQTTRTAQERPSDGDPVWIPRPDENAVLVALLCILVYVGVRYEFKFALGGVAALGHDILVVLGILSLTNKEITIPIIAALLTLGGYSINDTIVVFDRIRERLKGSGRAPDAEIFDLSINQTLSRTIMTALTVFLTVEALLFMGGSVIHDFAFAMAVGVGFGTYSSIFVASALALDISLSSDRRRQVAEIKAARVRS